MRNGRRVRLTWATCAIISMCFVGCAKAPTCKVSPVELEELREDIANLQRDLKTAKDREAQLTTDLATKQATLADRRAKPDSLRAQLEQVKKGVGKTEKAKEPAKAAPAKPAPAPAPTVKQPAPTPAPTPAAKTPPAAPKDTKAPAPKDSTKTPPAAPKKGTP